MSAEVVRLRAASKDDPPLSDEAVARACGAGDPAAVAALFDRFRRPVARYAHRLVGGRAQDVEDVVQSTFLEVARASTVYDGRSSVIAWLFGITTNVGRHHRRANARRLRLLAGVAHEPDRGTTGIEALADAREKLALARRAMEALADELREAFVLCDLEGMSAREAATVLGISEAAVWKRASRARESIRAFVRGGER
ncbi:MAG: RNA polymerase sigma factor [Deltaproteobacteria bacterium]|nr:RNA polymerase sigma factor [Deltaproteobacteria bacterium]